MPGDAVNSTPREHIMLYDNTGHDLTPARWRHNGNRSRIGTLIRIRIYVFLCVSVCPFSALVCSSFVKWLNSAKTQALFYEEPECAGSEPYARATTSAVTIDHAAGTIHVAQNGADTQRAQA